MSLLVAELVAGKRELIAGLVRDPQFGPCVLLGLGGILTEALGDVAFAAAPLSREDARALVGRLRASHLVTKPFRGEPAGDVEALADVLVALGRVGAERPDVASVDLNPILSEGARRGARRRGRAGRAGRAGSSTRRRCGRRAHATTRRCSTRLRPLFHPRGVLVAGVSAHPGKFGFVAYHNLLRFGFAGEVWALNRDGSEVLGQQDDPRRGGAARGRAPTSCSCARRSPPTPSCCAPARSAACARRSWRAAATARRARRGAATSASWSRSRSRSAWWWRARTGRA